jgi:hypothetical protein
MALPKRVMVYIRYYDKEESLYAVAQHIDDIPDDMDNTQVGIYDLVKTNTFHVKRSLA